MPHVELLRTALLTLRNVAAHDRLVPFNGDFGGAEANVVAEIIVDVMQNFRDKRAVFSLAVGLLHRLSDRNADIRCACATPEIKRRIEGVLHIVRQKGKFNEKNGWKPPPAPKGNKPSPGKRRKTALKPTSRPNSTSQREPRDAAEGEYFQLQDLAKLEAC